MTRLAYLMETDRTADPVPAAAHLYHCIIMNLPDICSRFQYSIRSAITVSS
jgi:hypothetical protein